MVASEPLAYELVAHLALSWLGFRIAELRASAESAGVSLDIDGESEAALEHRADSVLLRVRLLDEASALRLAERSVLTKSFVDVWASANTWDELKASLLAYPRDLAAPYLAEGTTFKVVVTSFGKKLTDAERMEYIRALEPLLPWKGKVSLKAAQHTFVVFVDSADGSTIPPSGRRPAATDHAGAKDGGGGERRPRFHFGRMVAEGRRDLVGKYDLKKRNYIGTTSLDAELSLLMANLARVRRNDLVYDPYCGTAGTLVAAGAFGARVLGCDLHLATIRGELRTRSGPSKLKQAKVQGIPETFAQYGLPPPIDRLHGDSGARLAFLRGCGASSGGGDGQSAEPSGPSVLHPPARGGLFDAIITDPPYGIRERSSEVVDERLISRELPAELMEGHVARTAIAALEQLLGDLFAFSARSLVPGGRLVFLLPTTEPFTASLLPAHPGLELETACEQLMAARWSRWVVVMRKSRGAEEDHTKSGSRGSRSGGDDAKVRICTADGVTRDLAAASAEAATKGHNAGREGVSGDGSAVNRSPQIFNRASLRPDDLVNGSVQGATAAASAVLHPELLGKSAGARKRHERRVAAAASHGAGPADESGSARSTRRRARNQGRGEYEEQVRKKLVAVGEHEGVGEQPLSYGGLAVYIGLGVGAMLLLGMAVSRSRQRS